MGVKQEWHQDLQDEGQAWGETVLCGCFSIFSFFFKPICLSLRLSQSSSGQWAWFFYWVSFILQKHSYWQVNCNSRNVVNMLMHSICVERPIRLQQLSVCISEHKTVIRTGNLDHAMTRHNKEATILLMFHWLWKGKASEEVISQNISPQERRQAQHNDPHKP